MEAVTFDETAALAALEMADPNALRIAILQATGDDRLAQIRPIKVPYWAGAYEVLALTPDDAAEVKRIALDFLRSGAPSRSPVLDDGQVRDLMGLMIGEPADDYIFNFGKEELNIEPFPRGVRWSSAVPPASRTDYRVMIVGAGAAGLSAAIMLQQLGIPFEIIERNTDVGGTWLVNDYPDARVDVASHHYQLSVTKNHPWRHWFAPQDELLDYLRGVADQFDLRRHIRFATEVVHARWDDATKVWEVTLRGPDGREETQLPNVVISAAGLFNEPNMPDIPGIETFAGPIFHTTNWRHDFDYTGKRVGVIGTGCTGAQLAPAIAGKAAKVDIFQRSPNWVSKLDGYRDPIPDGHRWLMNNVPHYWNWFDFSVFYTLYADDGSLQGVDEAWRHEGGMVNRKNDLLRDNIRAAILAEFAERPDLAEKLMPDWPPFARRLVVDNGWFDMLKQPHVSLVTDGIERITPHGIQTADGTEHPLDMIVAAGGFKAERYLWPVDYVGRDGLTLERAWETDGARTYLGITMPDFPNLFVIYGPNTNPRAGGLFAWLEIWARYAVQCVVAMIEGGHRSIECRQEVFDAFNARLDAAQDSCIWGMDGLKSYYINSHGRQAINNPLKPSESYALVREANHEDFKFA